MDGKERRGTRNISNPNDEATYKQVAYIGRLIVERAYPQGLTKGEAADLIDEILNGEGADMIAAAIIGQKE